MASSGTTTTGSVVTLGDADNEVILDDNDDSTGTRVIHQWGTLSEAVVSLGCGTASSTTPKKDVGTAFEIPSTGTDVGGVPEM